MFSFSADEKAKSSLCFSYLLLICILISCSSFANAQNYTTDWNLSPSASTPYEQFGQVVATDGAFVVVGVSANSTTSLVFIFEKGTVGGDDVYTLNSQLSGQACSAYGSAVAIHGSTIVVGAPDFSHNNLLMGAVYVYTYSGSTWTPSSSLPVIYPTDTSLPSSVVGNAGDEFGCSVAVLHNLFLAVGAKSASTRGDE